MAKPEEGRASLLDPVTLRRLFQQLEVTDVDELEVVCGSSRLYLRREPGARQLAASSRAVELEGPERSAAGVPIVAPLTGVFYSRPSAERPPYVSTGDTVAPGQVVALIETMKLFNEVIADVAGEVVAVSASDGDLVEAGQALIYIRPQEGLEEP